MGRLKKLQPPGGANKVVRGAAAGAKEGWNVHQRLEVRGCGCVRPVVAGVKAECEMGCPRLAALGSVQSAKTMRTQQCSVAQLGPVSSSVSPPNGSRPRSNWSSMSSTYRQPGRTSPGGWPGSGFGRPHCAGPAGLPRREPARLRDQPWTIRKRLKRLRTIALASGRG